VKVVLTVLFQEAKGWLYCVYSLLSASWRQPTTEARRAESGASRRS